MHTIKKKSPFVILALIVAIALSGCSMSDVFPKWNDPAYFGNDEDLGKETGGSGTGNETWKANW